MKITSVNNDLVKETAKLLRGKYRDETGLFLIEGEKGVKEAISAGVNIERIFVLEGIKDYPKEKIIETTEAVLSKISDAKSAPKVVAVAQQVKTEVNDIKKAKRVILLEGIKDAGNLGTILRTASAFGIDGIVLYGDTVDLYNPKCVRSTVGCLWKTPVIKVNDFKELKNIFTPYERVATLPARINVIKLENYIPSEKVLIMFGSEADGLSEELKNFATKNVTIEMAENVESLNLSISVGVVAYKLKQV
ncbi:MAG: RNA methyltransferase [Cyanobacteria bacterium SIG31]|nr:RNA methyltransferase [Cyanobacteria bacterium SIG31]